ncbi:hypothetical protein ACPCIZ_16215 [Streptomyces cellulosae]
MTHSEQPHPGPLLSCRALLNGTDWTALATAGGTGESLPAALALLTSPDPLVRRSALRDALGPVTHQNTVYEATVPVALHVAAILDHPVVTASDPGHRADGRPAHLTLVHLLKWLGDTAYDADDACVALEERLYGPGYLDDHAAMRAFRDARPVMFSAVRKFLDHGDPDVRHTALVAAIPLVEHPALVPHRTALADHARSLLATSTDRHHRDRALNALKGWGHDVGELETTSDVAARERCARLAAAHAARQGGFSQDPPF